MLKRNWALIAIVYLAFAEVLSLAPVPDLSLCLMQPEDSEQAADHNEPKYCPAFHSGIEVLFATTNEAFEHYEKLIIGGFTVVLALSTVALWLSTRKLWQAGERELKLLAETSEAQSRDMQASIAAAQQSANAAQMQAAIMAAVEGPIPLVAEIKLVQYVNIPGETVIVDPLPPGPIKPKCRILFAVENKGRTPLRLVELCIEKYVGWKLPNTPTYTQKTPWGLVLEKGPIWIRAADDQVEITSADLGQATAVYSSGGALWVFGYFAYLNLLSQRTEHRFLARWDLKEGFVPDNRPGYT